MVKQQVMKYLGHEVDGEAIRGVHPNISNVKRFLPLKYSTAPLPSCMTINQTWCMLRLTESVKSLRLMRDNPFRH
jgi:hypothetical protein